jgi:hypothetical protein
VDKIELFTAMDRLEWIIFAASPALISRIVVHFLDKNRIRREVEANGGRVVSITWDPSGGAWLIHTNEHHYAVAYLFFRAIVALSAGIRSTANGVLVRIAAR